jgi:hypothetical protein
MHLDDVSPVSPVAPMADVDVLALDEALEVSTATVEREWAFAKAWLLRRLSPAE